MFNQLTERLSQSLRKIINKGRLTEDNIKDTIREVRKALLEADVTLSVIKQFIKNVSEKSIGNRINKSLTPGQEFIKIVKNELITAMGEKNNSLNFSIAPPAVMLFVGLQGVGKTTTLIKVANWIKNKYKKKILATSTDIYRAAAIEQLKILSNQAKIDFYSSSIDQKPKNIIEKAIEYAKLKLYEVLLIDTAGRLHIDKIMMDEINQIQIYSNPIETLLVVDSMMGQDAVNMAKNFSKYLSISGIIITKTDSDARSGIALSMRYITGKPIKFVGTGEKITQLETFHPERIADRILGMNQVISFIKEIEEKVDKSQVEKLTKKFRKQDNFDLNDFLIQLKEMEKMGGVNHFIEKFIKNKFFSNNPLLTEKKNITKKIEAIIHSMTIKERISPIIIKGSRKRRIALGSGTKIQDVNQLLKNFNDIQRIMKKIKKGGITNIIRNIKNILPRNF